MAGMCGGLTSPKDADPEVHEICQKVKKHAEEKAQQSFDTFVPHSYATQVVAGTNYFIKVHVGDENHVHLRVFKSLPHAGSALSLHGVQTGKSVGDPIVHF